MMAKKKPVEWKTEGQEQRWGQSRQLEEERGSEEGELSPKMVRELQGKKANEWWGKTKSGQKTRDWEREGERLQQPVRQFIVFNAKVSVKLQGIAPMLQKPFSAVKWDFHLEEHVSWACSLNLSPSWLATP